MRTMVYRALGWNFGVNTLIMGTITFMTPEYARSSIRIGRACFINTDVCIDSAAPVVVGDGVAIGHHVVIVTTNHEIGEPSYRAGRLLPCAVTIGNGAWIASGVTILPGVSVGAGAIVAAGAVVTRDVAPNTMVGGVPARLIRVLDGDTDMTAVSDNSSGHICRHEPVT